MPLYDPMINERLKNGPKHAKYTSPDIQNGLKHVMGGMVQESICISVRNACVYTILADETKDCSKKKQLAIVLRYVAVKTVKLFEYLRKNHPVDTKIYFKIRPRTAPTEEFGKNAAVGIQVSIQCHQSCELLAVVALRNWPCQPPLSLARANYTEK